jgi:hypothetical protein
MFVTFLVGFFPFPHIFAVLFPIYTIGMIYSSAQNKNQYFDRKYSKIFVYFLTNTAVRIDYYFKKKYNDVIHFFPEGFSAKGCK